MRNNAKTKGIFLDFINGWEEHVHSLVSLGTEQTIADIVRLMKGESSHWINKEAITKTKFAWQNDYFCVGVCESMLRGDPGIYKESRTSPLAKNLRDGVRINVEEVWISEVRGFVGLSGLTPGDFWLKPNRLDAVYPGLKDRGNSCWPKAIRVDAK
jgi:hypothetical protein